MPRMGRDIDDRLADLDRRLREIQEELLPGRDPRPIASGPAGEPAPATEPGPTPVPPPESAPAPPPATAPEPPPPEPPPPAPEPPAPEPPAPEPARPPPPPAPEPPSAPEPPAPTPALPPAAPPPPSIAPITELHTKLLASFRELLDAYEWLLAQTAQPPRPGPPPSGPPAPGPAPPPLGPPGPQQQPTGVTAGPFASTDAVRAFEARLAALPGVRSVSVRGYEGADRAIFDIDLDQP